MKKILTALFVVLTAVILYIGIGIWGEVSPVEFMHENTTTISLAVDMNIMEGTVEQWVEQIPERYDVTVSKSLWSDDHLTSIFSTDITWGGKLKLQQGDLPQTGMDHFVASRDLETVKQTGTFQLFAPETTVLLYPANVLHSRGGYLGLLEIHTQDGEQVQAILSYLNAHVGPAKLHNTYQRNVVGLFLQRLENMQLLLGMFFLLVILFLFALVRYSIRESHTVAILELNGYGKGRILHFFAGELSGCILFSWLLSSLGAVILLIALRGLFLFPIVLLINTVVHLLLYAGCLLVLMLCNCLQHRRSKVLILKGKKPFAMLTALQLVVKYLVLAVLLLGVVQVHEIASGLEQQLAANRVWQLAENVYRIQTQFITNDLAAERQLEQKAVQVYQALEKEAGLMLMDANNYERMGAQLLWEVNTEGETSIYSVNGPTIKVNQNYLQVHPVQTTAGENVLELLQQGENVWNILVPEHLKEYEEEIKTNFQNDFYFQKVEVKNGVYAKELGEVQSLTLLEELKINVIYVSDGLQYFTYNAAILPEKQNQIADPLVVVDGHNVDDSFYYSYMTRCCYMVVDQVDPTGQLFTVAAQYGAQDMYASAAPVYDERAQEIQTLSKQLKLAILAEIILAVGAMIGIYLFCTCWYVQHQYEIMVKRLQGFYMVRICGRMLFFNIGLTLLLAVGYPGVIPMFIRIALPVLDLVITLSCCVVMNQKNLYTTLKGES